MHKLFTDGGARGNPGPAATGIFIFDENDKLVTFSGEYLGEVSNNFAEYSALLQGLTLANKTGIKSITCYLDSQLVVHQLNGVYKVKHEHMKILNEKVQALKLKFSEVFFVHVPREDNKFADKMVNIILDSV